ncbi:PAS domain-containing protein [Haloarchaeobius sp. DT45]|uniref:PAS domain-containing protein n=1 Tax=Haloarchaeobius sp. DT45 TaxID=3446116 RepID=UPI003F6AFBEF
MLIDSTQARTGLVTLVMADTGNEHVLSRWLDERQIPVTSIDPGARLPEGTDICIVDLGACKQAATEIRDRKAADRAFLPCVLVVTDRLAPRVAASDDPRFDFVDEIVTVPIDSSTLRHRVDRLLQLRRQSTDRQTASVTLSSVVDSLPFPAFAVSDGRVTDSNAALQCRLGTTADELHGRRLTTLVPAAARDRVDSLFADDGPGVERVTLVEEDRRVSAELRRLLNEEGGLAGYLGMCYGSTTETDEDAR